MVLFWGSQLEHHNPHIESCKICSFKLSFNPEPRPLIAFSLQVFQGSRRVWIANLWKTTHHKSDSCTKTLNSLSAQMPRYPNGAFSFCEWELRRFVVWIILYCTFERVCKWWRTEPVLYQWIFCTLFQTHP